jgi:hypothetical protein
LEPQRLDALYEAKARALVRDHFPVDAQAIGSVPITGGAALYEDGRVWLYLANDPDRSLGRALALADQRGAREIHILVDEDGDVARRASLLVPPVHVWRISGTQLEPALPPPLPVEPPPPAGADVFVAMLHNVGAEAVEEHGVIYGEVRGLEVARVRVGDDANVVLDVGVGRFDQEANAVLHAGEPTEAALANAVREVAAHRRHEARPHPVNRLARERWLRSQLVDDPTSVGLVTLRPIAPPLPRTNLKAAAPAAALGTDGDGRKVLAMSSVGVDLDLIPVTADLVARERPDRVVIATPARDQVPVQRRLASRLDVPTAFVAVEGDWPA